MASGPLSHEVSDLTLGKPPLFSLPLSTSIANALQTLKQRDDPEISVWDCTHRVEGCCKNGECHCVGKICMQKIICYLSTDESLINLSKALNRPISVLLQEPTPVVQHINSHASIPEALSFMVDGIQDLIVALDSRPFGSCRKIVHKSKSLGHSCTSHNGKDYCWLTQEDVMRFLIGFVGLFSPLAMMSIEELGLINEDVLVVEAEQEAISALDLIAKASQEMSAVAVVEMGHDGGTHPRLIGDISPSTLRNCDETAALALATLNARDFLLYVKDCKNPPQMLVNEIRLKILEKFCVSEGDLSKSVVKKRPTLDHMGSPNKQDMEGLEPSFGDKEERDIPTEHQLARIRSSAPCPSLTRGFCGQGIMSPIVCHPWSSLIAVMLQALVHRESHVWVVDEEETLVGIVTFTVIVDILLQHLTSPD